jgi:ribosomal-protein-alanine N-acetyltransferase
VRHLLLDGVDEVEIGYGFQPAYWGRGLATEIAAACVRYGFDMLDLPSVVGVTVPHNTRSRRVLEKVGMAYERDVLLGEVPHVLYRAFAAR